MEPASDEPLAPPWAWATEWQVSRPILLLKANRKLTCWTAERRDGYYVREELPMPTQPPYTAHLANLSFDATQDDINDFFKDCQVTNVRIVEDKMDRKPKGFGYVEFATVDGLKAALALSGSNLSGRQVRVSVAEPRKFSIMMVLAPMLIIF
jgi:hypothetical protein